MSAETRQQMCKGLKQLFLGVVLSALSSVGPLFGMEGSFFTILFVISLVFCVLGLRVLCPIESRFCRAMIFVLLALAVSLISSVVHVKLLWNPLAIQIIGCLRAVLLGLFSALYVRELCLGLSHVLKENGDSDTSAMGEQAFRLYWGCVAIALICQFLSLAPSLNGIMLQAGSVAAVFREFLLGAFLNKGRKSLEG